MVLVSPASTDSEWVDKECAFWLATKGTRRIQLVLLAGTLAWDTTQSRFSADSVVPPSLRAAFPTEPNYRDLRWTAFGAQETAEPHTLSDERFERDVVALSAPIRRQSVRVLGWRHRHPQQRRVAAITAAVVLSVAVAGGLWSYSHRNAPIITDCDAGLRPYEGSARITDGVLFRSSTPKIAGALQVGLGIAGGLVDSPESGVQRLGYAMSDEKGTDQYSSLDRVPSDDTLLQENGDANGPGRLFIAEAGAVFQIRDAGALWRDLHLDHNEAVIIPKGSFDTFDSEAFKPRKTALLHVHGSDDYWFINHRHLRQPARRRCDGAHVVDLPNSPGILETVGVAPRVAERPQPVTHSVPWKNLTPAIDLAPCSISKTIVNGFVTNVSNVKARFDLRVRLVNDRGNELGAEHVKVPALGPRQGVDWHAKLRQPIEAGMHCRVWVDPTEVDANGHDVGVRPRGQ